MSGFDNITIGLKSAIGVAISAIMLITGVVVAYDKDQAGQNKKIHKNEAKDRVLKQKQKEMDRRISIQEDLFLLQYELNKKNNALPPAGTVPVPPSK